MILCRNCALGSSVEGEEAKHENESSQRCQGHRVTRDGEGFSVRTKSANSGSQERGSDKCTNTAKQMNNSGSGKIWEIKKIKKYY